MTLDTTSIDTVFVHVTKACDLKCAYCYLSARDPLPDELTASEFSRLWYDMIAVSPSKVVFTGGEPLLRGDIFEILQGLREADAGHRIIRCLNTNGYKLTSDTAKRLIGLVDEVRVSVDALEKRNDELRGKGSFVRAMGAIDLFRTAGLEPKIMITVTRHSLPDLDELIRVLICNGITRINVARFRPFGRGLSRPDWSVSRQEIAVAVEKAWHRIHPSHPPPANCAPVGFQRTCGVGRFLNVMPNGDVFPCHVLRQPEFRCGNLRSQSLSTICNKTGLLARLADIDFTQLKEMDCRLGLLTERGVCMGEVYQQCKSSEAWNIVCKVPTKKQNEEWSEKLANNGMHTDGDSAAHHPRR